MVLFHGGHKSAKIWSGAAVAGGGGRREELVYRITEGSEYAPWAEEYEKEFGT